MRERSSWIDAARGLAVCLVVLLHTTDALEERGFAVSPWLLGTNDVLEGFRSPELTPSARSLEELRTSGESFADFALRMSRLHKAYFLDLYPPNEQRLAEFADEAAQSLQKQADIEAADRVTFDQFLQSYFAQ